MAKDEQRLRTDAALIRAAALAAVDPEILVARAFEEGPGRLPAGSPVRLVAFGKAAAGMARAARRVLGARCDRGVLIVPAGARPECPDGFKVFEGGHPLPDEGASPGPVRYAT